MPEEFHHIRRLPPYVFAEVNKAKACYRAAGGDIIDLGMGNPDPATPPHIVAKLVFLATDNAGPVWSQIGNSEAPVPDLVEVVA
jgi:alanine-synthesizing transaminase